MGDGSTIEPLQVVLSPEQAEKCDFPRAKQPAEKNKNKKNTVGDYELMN